MNKTHRHKTRRHSLLRGGACLGLLLPSGMAIAQSAAPVARGGLEEVIVTAQRRQTRLQKTPVAVTSLNAKALDSKGVTSLLDLGSAVPNLQVSSRSTTGSTSGGFTLRGIGTDATGSSPSVGIYIDDVYYPAQVGNLLGLFDINRIEVLRGPQGTLFGRNTIAGAIQYIGNRPSNTLGGYAETTLGSYGRREVDGALNLPLTSTLSMRVAGELDDVGGFVKDATTGVERGADRTSFGKVQLHWTPTADLTFDVRGDILHDAQNGRAIAVIAGPSGIGPNPLAVFPGIAAMLGVPLTNFGPGNISRPGSYDFVGFTSPDYFNYDYHGVSGVAAWNVNQNLTLKAISAYSYDRADNRNDLSDSPTAILDADKAKVADSLFTEEVQAIGNLFSNRLNYTLGGYYFDNTSPSVGQNVIFGGYGQGFFPDGLLASLNDGDYKLHDVSKAVYGQVRYTVLPKLNFTGGLRYSEERVTGSYLNTVTATPPMPIGFVNGFPLLANQLITTPEPAFPSKNVGFTNLSPSFGLDYQALPDLLVYGKASRGFRAGGFNISVQTPGAFQPFGPETAWTYEAGLRTEWLDHRLRVNPTVFQTEWDKIQFNTFDISPTGIIPITSNAGNAIIRGFELESAFAATEALAFNGSLSWLEGHYSSIDQGINLSPGSPLQHAPKFKFDIGATYTADLGSYGRILTTADFNWTAKERSAVTDSDFIEQPAYNLFNAQIEYDPARGRWSLIAYGLNLTNQYYYIGGTNGGRSSPFDQGTTGTPEADLGRPREVGVKLRYRF